MLFYACFALINGLFRPVGQFVPRTSRSLRQTASDEISEIQYFDVNKLPDVYPSDITLIKRLSERVNCIENELA
jgi:hypothetical protein